MVIQKETVCFSAFEKEEALSLPLEREARGSVWGWGCPPAVRRRHDAIPTPILTFPLKGKGTSQLAKWLQGILLASAALSLGGCSAMLDKLENVYEQPPLAKVENPQQVVDYKPMTWPLPATTPRTTQHAGSLWQPGARAFFRDQRAARVGDILRVNVKISDKAQLDNKSDRTRTTQDVVNAPKFLGLEKVVKKITGEPTEDLVDIDGKGKNNGQAKIDRQEKIETQVAAAVTQVLPNGNFVIQGSQEIRVNYEIREISVKGVIRPEDIGMDNTVDSSQIAEARIVYGGRGQMMDVAQPRWGSQVVDIISPF